MWNLSCKKNIHMEIIPSKQWGIRVVVFRKEIETQKVCSETRQESYHLGRDYRRTILRRGKAILSSLNSLAICVRANWL